MSTDWLCGLSDNEHIDDESVRSYSDIIRFCYSNAEHIKNSAKAIGKITLSFIRTMEKFSKESSPPPQRRPKPHHPDNHSWKSEKICYIR